MTAPNPEKGARYLALLDQALCSGNWSEVPELARKLDKHAPERRCLGLTARIEAQVAATASKSVTQPPQLDQDIAKLREVINASGTSAEDSYIANACISEIFWLRKDWDNAINTLPSDFSTSNAATGASMLGWLEVCSTRSSVIRATVAEQRGLNGDVRQLYLSAAQRSPGLRCSELRKWTERLLARACMYTYEQCSTPTLASLSEALRCFMAWSDFWRQVSRPSPPEASFDIARISVWKSFYDLHSIILQRGLMFNPAATSPSTLLTPLKIDFTIEQITAFKLRQRSSFAEVEATYESLLFNDSKFPTANQSNVETESWVDQVMNNWSVFCGSQWRESELGEGGTGSISRGVLDILYRAAARTFHSTSILRHLFHVHAGLGDFDLAFHAFDNFVELVDKAEARAQKNGGHMLGLDAEGGAIQTAAEAIRILCRYGDSAQAEKAISISNQIQRWIDQGEHISGPQVTNGISSSTQESEKTASKYTGPALDESCLARAYLAMGVARAHWARLTYDPELRGTLQTEALQLLRRAHAQDPSCLHITYALVLIFIEVGDVHNATQLLKRAIASVSSVAEDGVEEGGDDIFCKQRQLVSLWHLLALCLTSKDDYEQAVQMCDAAFEQFGDPAVLLGNEEHLSDSAHRSRRSRGLLDQMEGIEKEGIMQIKITQLKLIELTEGPDAALDMTHALLGLYARLFGNQEPSNLPGQQQRNANIDPPARTNPIRNLAGSIRPKSSRNSAEKEVLHKPTVFTTSQPSAISVAGRTRGNSNSQSIDQPISITVTNEDGQVASKHHHKHRTFKLRATPGDWRHSRNADDSQKKTANEKANPLFPTGPGVQNATTRAAHNEISGNSPDPRQALEKVPHHAAPSTWPPPAGHDDQPPQQDVRLPTMQPANTSLPDPRLHNLQDVQQRLSLLIHIWLVIAGLYTRSNLLSDAAEAIDEADSLARGFEEEIASEKSQAGRFSQKHWGGGKGVDELWADVLCAKGQLASARNVPFEAMSHYNQALSHCSDHADATIGVSNILMDIYEGKLPVEQPKPTLTLPSTSISQILTNQTANGVSSTAEHNRSNGVIDPVAITTDEPPAAHLNRLAARDRAYMLLFNLTRLGSGWDNPEAWYSLARAHELSRQVLKAKQALWWVVELEENRPLRPWREVAVGGFTL